MTTDHRQSLRGLARRLGVQHSALSQAAAVGRLTEGLSRDARGRLVVVDADAVAAQWAEVSILPVTRQARPAAPPPPPDPLSTELYDRKMDRWITAGELFRERDSESLLGTALMGVMLDQGIAPAELRQLVAAQLRIVAELHGSDADDVARAKADFDEKALMLAEFFEGA